MDRHFVHLQLLIITLDKPYRQALHNILHAGVWFSVASEERSFMLVAVSLVGVGQEFSSPK
jgi:hypothetical protein